MTNNKKHTNRDAKEDVFERSGRIFLGEEGLAASSNRLGKRLTRSSGRKSKWGIARFLLPLVAAVLLFFAYIAWPVAAELSLEQRLEQALLESMSLVALGESMNGAERAFRHKDQLHAFKVAYGQKQYEQALTHLMQLAEGGNEGFSAVSFDLYLADIHLKLRQYEKALLYLEQVGRDDQTPLQADVAYCTTYFKGLAYLALGQQQTAIRWLQRSAQQGGKLGEEADSLLRYLSEE